MKTYTNAWTSTCYKWDIEVVSWPLEQAFSYTKPLASSQSSWRSTYDIEAKSALIAVPQSSGPTLSFLPRPYSSQASKGNKRQAKTQYDGFAAA